MSLSKNYSIVTLEENKVIKEGLPKLMKIEYEKTLQAFNIFNKSDFFCVPKILDYDQEKGRIVFERIENVLKVGRFQNLSIYGIDTTAKIATGLANIHMNFNLPENLIEPLPKELADYDSQQVFIHGDFTGNNILFSPNDNKLYIIDWMMTKSHEGMATYGTAFWDIAWFLNFQFYSIINLDYFNRKIEQEALTFIISYSKEIKFDFNIHKFSDYLLKFVNCKISLRKRTLPYHHFIRLWPSHLRFISFAKRLKYY